MAGITVREQNGPAMRQPVPWHERRLCRARSAPAQFFSNASDRAASRYTLNQWPNQPPLASQKVE